MAIRFLRNSLMAAAALLALAGFVNFEVDPFQQYRVPTTHEARFYRAFQRYEDPGIARHYEYDRAIISSSLMENVSGSEVDRAFGSGKTMNLCLSAMTAYDGRKVLEVALESRPLKQVLYSVDYNAFSGDPGRVGYGKLPLYLYDTARWNDYPYLLSSGTLGRSLDIVLDWREGQFRTDADNPWYWADDGTGFGAKKVIDELDLANINGRYKQPQRTMEGMWASFEANVEPLVRAHPQTEFIFIWPPYSIFVWIDFARRDQLDVSLEFKRRFVLAMSKYPNVRIHDFQERTDWIMDLAEYRDIYHYSPKISSQLVKDVAAGKDEITPENVDARNAELRTIATTADIGKIVAEARAAPVASPR
ncbi:MAG: hypothetical protein WA190_17040 [Usitatibacter sp.]